VVGRGRDADCFRLSDSAVGQVPLQKKGHLQKIGGENPSRSQDVCAWCDASIKEMLLELRRNGGVVVVSEPCGSWRRLSGERKGKLSTGAATVWEVP